MAYKIPNKRCSLKNDKPVRFDIAELKKRVQFILEKEVCQVCEESYQLDAPHHAVYGLGVKDDRTLINICLRCHRLIHNTGYDTLKKTREEIEAIGWENNEQFLHTQE